MTRYPTMTRQTYYNRYRGGQPCVNEVGAKRL